MRFLKDLFHDAYDLWGSGLFVLGGLAWIIGRQILPESASWPWMLAAVAAWLALAYHRRWTAYQDLEKSISNPKLESIKRQQVGQILATHLSLGETIVRQIRLAQEEESVLIQRASEWGSKTQVLIEAAYGHGEAALFYSDAGYTFFGSGKPITNCLNWVDGRLRRLTELLERAQALPLRDEFDPGSVEAR